MAEKRFIKGLFKDTAHIDQPAGTWRYAKNAIFNDKKGSVSNEGGTEFAGILGNQSQNVTGNQNSKVIGAIEVNNNKVVLFSTDVVNTFATTGIYPESEIGIWSDHQYYQLLSLTIDPLAGGKLTNDLNFRESNPIEGIFKVDSKGDLIVYWTDDLNPPRAFNVDRQIRESSPVGALISVNKTQLYGILSTVLNDINILNLFPYGGPVPQIDLDSVESIFTDVSGKEHTTKPTNYQGSVIEGGGLLTAVYYLALAYVDDDFVATNYLTVSNPVSIVEEFDSTYPHIKKDGAKHGTQTTKAIKWLATNLNIDYNFLRPVVIRKMGDAAEAFKLNDLEVPTTGATEVVFSGIEGRSKASVNDVIVDTISYEKAKTINQLDGVLYLGNVVGRNDLDYQKYANNIKLRARVKVWEDFDPYSATVDHLTSGFGTLEVDKIGSTGPGPFVKSTQSYRYQPNIYKYKGYTRGEVYAFYIAFIMKDGSMSYGYHIPGREDAKHSVSGNTLERIPINQLNINTYGGLFSDIYELSPQYSQAFHFIDSWILGFVAPGLGGGGAPSLLANFNNMNYWENSTEFYPNTSDFDVWDETSFVSGTPISSIKGLNVRHHHFPSNRTTPMQSIGTEVGDSKCYTEVSLGSATTSNVYNNTIFTQFHIGGNVMNPLTGANENATGASLGLGGGTTHSFGRDSIEHPDVQINAGPGNLGFGQNMTGPAGTSALVPRTGTDQAASSTLWQGNHFVANQDMDVQVQWACEFDGAFFGASTLTVQTMLYRQDVGGGVIAIPTTSSDSALNNLVVYSASCIENVYTTGPGGGVNNPVFGWGPTITLAAGDKLMLRSQKTYTGPGVFAPSVKIANYNQTAHLSHSGVNSGGGNGFTIANCALNPLSNILGNPTNPSHTGSWISFKVNSVGNSVNSQDIHDAYINHKVNILGFDLEDIKIPKTIGDQIQGFRIYYAKRDHADRTVLGQSPLTPNTKQFDQLGICSTAALSQYGSQVLSTLQSKPEDFWNLDAFSHTPSNYTPSNINPYWSQAAANNPVLTSTSNTTYSTMECFTFHDFYLLRSKNSLASATHIDLQYRVENFAWNAMSLNQDRKMVTKLSQGAATTDPLKIKEEWGWDSSQNCYPQYIYAGIFIGAIYNQLPLYEQPRLLAQKAKTYLLGDSIFNGDALGFGGKLFNEFGESCIVFRTMHEHGIGAYPYRSYARYSGVGHFQNPDTIFNEVGRGTDGQTLLTVTMNTPGVWDDSSYNHKSRMSIVNLKAFKTDVYKSIDSQELVWTGFQVVGSDIDNFIFDENGQAIVTSLSAPNAIGVQQVTNYQTISTTEGVDGIYGGDTYICRYGFPTALKYSQASKMPNPERAINYQIVESTDNINFRHEESDQSRYFPNTPAKTILQNIGNIDYNHFDNLKYNVNYSALNNIRPAFPLPLREIDQTDFSTRTHRSAKNDTTSIIDNYRLFLANQFKDLPKDRGELWKLSAFNNLLYFHMEESLFAAKGKQSMSMKDGSEAFVGSGDIFQQDPDEVVQTEGGYAGTKSQYAALTTRHGYFFVDAESRKVFLMKDSLTEISNAGMANWFKDNLITTLSAFGFEEACMLDNPILGMGFHSIYDPKYKRIILTKRDLKPTQAFLDGVAITAANSGSGALQQAGLLVVGAITWNSNKCYFQIVTVSPQGPGQPLAIVKESISITDPQYFEKSGWTISYYPDLGIWGSFHDYIPYIYFNTSTDFYSLTDKYARPVWVGGTLLANHPGTTFGNAAIWKHNSNNNKGILYQENFSIYSPYSNSDWLTRVNHFPFEFEVIHNETKSIDSLFPNFNYTLETFNSSNISVLEHGFTHYLLYNTMQISGVGNAFQDLNGVAQTDANGTVLTATDIDKIEYLINTRRVGNNWKVNNFRDMAALAVDTSPYYIASGNNLIGTGNVGTITTSSTNNMFIVEGMNEIVNAAYIDLAKNWDKKKKFMDKWVGIRLIYDNITNNLLNLYSTEVDTRQIHR